MGKNAFKTYKLTQPQQLSPTNGNEATTVYAQQSTKSNEIFSVHGKTIDVIDFTTAQKKSTIDLSNDDAVKIAHGLKLNNVYSDNDVVILNGLERLFIQFKSDQSLATRTFSKAQKSDVIYFGAFCNDSQVIGVITNSKEIPDSRTPNENRIAISVIDKSQISESPTDDEVGVDLIGKNKNKPQIFDDIKKIRPTHVAIVDRVTPDDIQPKFVIRDSNSVKTYRIDSNFEIELIHTLSGIVGPMSAIGEREVLLFGNITGKATKYLNCLVRNLNGLYLYEFDGQKYQLLKFDPSFSDANGWGNPNFLNTIKLFDFNGDGVESLAFTGPNGLQILKFDRFDNIWVTLLENNLLPPLDRHARLLSITKTGGTSKLITQSSKTIQSWNLELTPASYDILSEPPAKKARGGSKPELSENEMYAVVKDPTTETDALFLSLKSTLDYNSFMRNNVDIPTGSIKFNIPLLTTVSRHFNMMSLFYDSSLDDATIVGRGWTLPDQQIVFDDQGSMFPIDHRYYLISYDTILEMFPIGERQDDGVTIRKYSFSAPTEKDDQSTGVIIEYNEKTETWRVPKNDATYVYGSKSATGYDIVWELWRGRGNSEVSQIQLPKTWNLAEIRDASDKVLLTLEYDTVKGTLQDVDQDPEHGPIFTRQMYLTSAVDSEGNRLELHYEDKTDDEINIASLLVKDGNFEKYTVATKYLKYYQLSAPSVFSQIINFEYEVRGKDRLLTKLIDTNNDESTPVLKFSYDQKKYLSEIDAPKIMKTTFTHKAFTELPMDWKSSIPVSETSIELEPNVYHAANAILVFYLTIAERKLRLTILSPDGKETLNTYKDFKMTQVKEYRVLVTDNMFSVLLISEPGAKSTQGTRELYLFHLDADKNWVLPNVSTMENVYDLGERALVRGGRDYVVFTNEILASNDDGCFQRKRPKQPAVIDRSAKVIPPQSFLTHVYYKDGKLVERKLIDSTVPYKESDGEDLRFASIAEEVLIATERNVFVSVAAPAITMHYREANGNWAMSPIAKISNTLGSTQAVFDKFSLNCSNRKFIMQTFKETALQINDNVITFYRLAFDSKQTTILGNTKVVFVSDEYRYKSMDKFDQPKDTIAEVKDNCYEGFVCAYEWSEALKQFRIKVSPHPPNAPGAAIPKEQFDIINSLEERLKSSTLLQLRDYLAVFDSGKFIQNGTVMQFDGNAFTNKTDALQQEVKMTYPYTVDLTEALNLKQNNENGDIHLVNTEDNQRINLHVDDVKDVKAFLPNYVTYEKHGQVIVHPLNSFGKAVAFDNQDFMIQLPGEKSTEYSNSKVLVTVKDGELGKQAAKLRFRQISPLPAAYTVNSNALYLYSPPDDPNGDGYAILTPRVTHFMYSQPRTSGTKVLFDTVDIFPGSNNQEYGKIQYFNSISNRNESRITTFNSDQVVVKVENTGEQKKQVKNPLDEKAQANIQASTIMDKEGEVSLFEAFPFKLENDEVDYFGFEGYEHDHSNRTYNRDDVIRNEFPRTGKNFLRVKGGKGYVASYTPKDQGLSYKAFVWVRSNKVPALGSLSPVFKANIYQSAGDKYICSVLSVVKVKSEFDNWYLLEARIDLPALQQFATKAKDTLPNIIVIREKQSASSATEVDIPGSSGSLTIELSVVPSRDQQLDLDHVFFAPSILNSEIKVYEPRLWQVTHEITSNGLIKQSLYDAYSNEVGVVNEINQITEITSYTSPLWLSFNDDFKQQQAVIAVTGKHGYYEPFSTTSFAKAWKATPTRGEPWEISPHMLRHTSESEDSITLETNFHASSIAVRFIYVVTDQPSAIKINEALLIDENGLSYNGADPSNVAYEAEIIVIIEGGRLFVLVDGIVHIDNEDATPLLQNSEKLKITATASATIKKLVVLHDPSISITYINKADEEIQKVQLEGNGVVIVRGYENDQLGRKVKESFPQKLQSSVGEKPCLGYNPKILPGEPGIKYRELVYQNDSTTEVKYITIPDSDFAFEKGLLKYFTRLAPSEVPRFIQKNFNIVQGFTYQVEQRPDDVKDISVFNSDMLKVAKYTWVKGAKGLLSTYEYDENNQLLKTFPPEFYNAYSEEQLENLELINRNDQMAVKFEYDKDGRKVAFRNPDAGKRETVYNTAGFPKFEISFEYKNEGRIHSIIYFNYDEANRLIASGYFTNPGDVNYQTLVGMKDKVITNTEYPASVDYQKFEYDDKEPDTFLRNNVKRIITVQNDETRYPYADEVVTNINQRVLTRRVYLPILKSEDKVRMVEVKKEYYNTNSVARVEYPFETEGETLKVGYVYDKLGKITAIIGPKNEIIAKYEYNAEGSVIKEIFAPNKKNGFGREYGYNELGLYSSLSDKYLDVKLDYSGVGYGSFGRGDGSVTEIKYNAKWHNMADDLSLQVTPESFMKIKKLTEKQAVQCFNQLKANGVIDETNHQAKIFSETYHEKVSTVCDTHRKEITKILGKEGFPKVYGHRYDFGNNNELTKAKYFVGDRPDKIKPLQVSSFTKKFQTKSEQIWAQLRNRQFIIEENVQAKLQVAQGKQGKKSMIRKELYTDLSSASPMLAVMYEKTIARMLISNFIKNKIITEQEFIHFLKLDLIDAKEEDKLNQEGSAGYAKLRQEGYLTDPIDPELKAIFGDKVRQGVKILHKHFKTQIGKCEFDMESYEIDANGNHKRYMTGYEKIQLDYEPNTNRIKTLKRGEQTYNIQHDSQGNVVEAQHKKIKKIEYHPVVNKISKVTMDDGRVIKYTYDAKADRSGKRIFKDGKLIKEHVYIRDDNGRSMVEREISYLANSKPVVTVTAYVYGVKGLIGYFRNNQYHNVIVDHEGSIRLIERNGEIVAAYDYFPYGGVMRSFEKDPSASIAYRFTGQEYDAETGLYYYIARYYDPEVGRFYQIDPMGQYFSPYKYSGNSPVSMVDPDGEFAFLAIAMLVTGLIGAYLGGAAANGSYLPWEWDFSSKETWAGIAAGGITGALAPVGFMGSAAILGGSVLAYAATTAVGVAFAYYQGVKLTGTFNILEWDFKNPRLLSSVYMGFCDGVAFLSDVLSVKKAFKVVQFYKGLSTLKKVAFIGALAGTFTINTYVAASAHDFNFNDPEVIKDIISGLISAPFEVRSFSKGLGKIGKRYKSARSNLKLIASGTKDVKSFINPEVGYKLIKHTGEVLLATEAVATKSLDIMTAVHNDDRWNIGGSKAYTSHIQSMLSANKKESLRWQAAKFYIPRKHYTIITKIKTRKPTFTPETLATVYQNSGRNGNTHVSSVQVSANEINEAKIDKEVTLIETLKDKNFNMFVFSDDEAQTHIVLFKENNPRHEIIRINKAIMDQPEFAEEVTQAIKKKIASNSREVSREFANNKIIIKRKLMSYGGLLTDVVVDGLLSQIIEKVDDNESFIGTMQEDLKAELDLAMFKLNLQIMELKSKELLNEITEPEKRQLENLLATKSSVGTIHKVEETFWEKSDEGKKLESLNGEIAKWSIDEKSANDVLNRCNAQILPSTQKQSDIVYNEGERSIFSVPINSCEYCPKTIASLSHSSFNELQWTEEIQVEALGLKNQGLFYDPEPCSEDHSRIKRSTNKMNQTANWIVSKINNCMKVLNYLGPKDLLHAAPQEPLFNSTEATFTPDYSITDVNSTLMLVDMCVRKITGEAFKAYNMNLEVDLMKAQIISLSIMEEVEDMLAEALNNVELVASIDFVELQCRVFETMAKGYQSKVNDVILNYLSNALGSLTAEEESRIKKYFNKNC